MSCQVELLCACCSFNLGCCLIFQLCTCYSSVFAMTSCACHCFIATLTWETALKTKRIRAQLKLREHVHNSNWESKYTTQCAIVWIDRTCTQFKLREHVHSSNWENMYTTQTERTCTQLKLREHVHISKWFQYFIAFGFLSILASLAVTACVCPRVF